MARVGTLLSLLRLLSASGGEVETRIRLQKEVYLLSLKYPNFFDAGDFEYHHYGPYSRFLSENLQYAVSSGLIEEINESPEDMSFTKYKYVLTDFGSEAVAENPFEAEEFHGDVRRLQAENWRTLELAATVKYLESKEGLNSEAAFAKALKLKPATAGFANEARALLLGAEATPGA